MPEDQNVAPKKHGPSMINTSLSGQIDLIPRPEGSGNLGNIPLFLTTICGDYSAEIGRENLPRFTTQIYSNDRFGDLKNLFFAMFPGPPGCGQSEKSEGRGLVDWLLLHGNGNSPKRLLFICCSCSKIHHLAR